MFIIQTRNLHFRYANHAILKGINLQVPPASIFGLLGLNGAGKSTTLKLLLGLLEAPPQSVFLFGKELNQHRMAILGSTGALIDHPAFYDHLSGRDNLAVLAKLLGLKADRVARVLELTGLAEAADKPARAYSTGMKQRLGLAIALLNDPRVLILDEPANGLDPVGIIEFRNLLLSLQQEHGKTILLSSHLLDELQKIITHVAVLHEGQLCFQGRTGELTGGGTTLEASFLDLIAYPSA
jgi:ABC-2 type transport system ATP-binding protein